MEIKIKKLAENAKIPTRGSDCAAGYDLYALNAESILPGETCMVGTGIAIEIPKGYFGAIYARSGLACKRGLRPANCVGIIDSDYRGELIVALHNDNPNVSGYTYTNDYDCSETELDLVDAPQVIEAGERIAQLVIQRFESINFVEVDELSDTGRGEGGFGSTGSN